MINNVVLVGRTTRDTELKKTQTGKSVVSFTLAVNRMFKTEEQSADFINVVAWNHSADFMGNYVHKGDLLGVVGRIQTRNYEDKSGNTVYITEIVADNVQALESKKEKEARTVGDWRTQRDVPEYETKDEQGVNEEFGGPTLDISSDDLPF